jgi:Raf kinase inhibitor-like YbhB/YbcL family protein
MLLKTRGSPRGTDVAVLLSLPALQEIAMQNPSPKSSRPVAPTPRSDNKSTQAASPAEASGAPAVALPPFELKSADLLEGEVIRDEHVFKGMGCAGGNVSPSLEWSNAPAGTKSFAVTLYDPDAPTGSGWWHWVMYDIPASVNRLPSGAGDPSRQWMPGVAMGTTDFGKKEYGGPCPPKGDPAHHYIFTVHALDVEKLDVPGSATAAAIGFNLNAHRLGVASLTGVYGR